MKRLALCVAVLAAGCSTSGDPAEPQSRTIRMDARTNRFNASFLAFFPSTAAVRQGDTVVFEAQWTGEPHAAALGTVVDRALSGDAGVILPRARLSATERLVPSASEACVIETGAPPTDTTPCPPRRGRVAFDGRQAYVSTGFLARGTKFRLPIARDAVPGKYRLVCTFHGPPMTATLDIRTRGTRVPSQGDLDRAAREQRDALVRSMLPRYLETERRYRRARAGKFPFPAVAGLTSDDGVVRVLEFVPFTIKVRREEEVTWTVAGAHSIAFDPPRRAGPPAIERLDNGSVSLVGESFAVRGGPDPPPPPATIRGRRWSKDVPHASGYLTGALTYALRIADLGTHEYRCTIHPRMSGLVTVSA